MGIQTYIFSNGTRALLQRKGNQSIMQILDEAGNVLRTRCKSISRTTVPVSTEAPVRTSIGFVPQQLRSHINDRTRLQIGFRLPGQKPERYKTNIERNKNITITKTEFDSNMNITSINNIQRKYNPKGEFIGVAPVGTLSRKQIADLNQQQRQILMAANEAHLSIISDYELNLAKFDSAVSSFSQETKSLYQNQKEIEKLLQITQKETESTFAKGMQVDLYSQFWTKQIVPRIETTQFAKYGRMNPCEQAEKQIIDKLSELTKRKEHLEELLSDTKSQIAKRTEEIGMFSTKRNTLVNALEQMKMHYTKAETEMRQKLCDIQREITSIITKQNT